MTLGDVLETEAKADGWRALLEERAMYKDAPADLDFFEWCEGRKLAINALAAATWQRWLTVETGREAAFAETCQLFRLPLRHGKLLLDEVDGYAEAVTDLSLLVVIQAWMTDRGLQTVGAVAEALQLPVDLIGRVVPAEGTSMAFCYRSGITQPMADQLIELSCE